MDLEVQELNKFPINSYIYQLVNKLIYNRKRGFRLNKIRKILNLNTLPILNTILGFILVAIAVAKKDLESTVVGLLIVYTGLNSIAINSNDKRFNKLQKQIDEISSKLGDK